MKYLDSKSAQKEIKYLLSRYELDLVYIETSKGRDAVYTGDHIGVKKGLEKGYTIFLILRCIGHHLLHQHQKRTWFFEPNEIRSREEMAANQYACEVLLKHCKKQHSSIETAAYLIDCGVPDFVVNIYSKECILKADNFQ